MKKYLSFATISILLFTGCASKQETYNENQTTQHTITAADIMLQEGIPMHDPYTFRMKPLIGSENNDARTVVDMGTVLKIWIAPFKNTSGGLIAAHNVYIWGRQPDFITGEEVPTAMRKNGGTTYRNMLPFSLSETEIDRSDISNDINIQKFIDTLPMEDLTKVEEKTSNNLTTQDNDEAILDFIRRVKNIDTGNSSGGKGGQNNVNGASDVNGVSNVHNRNSVNSVNGNNNKNVLQKDKSNTEKKSSRNSNITNYIDEYEGEDFK